MQLKLQIYQLYMYRSFNKLSTSPNTFYIYKIVSSQLYYMSYKN